MPWHAALQAEIRRVRVARREEKYRDRTQSDAVRRSLRLAPILSTRHFLVAMVILAGLWVQPVLK
jgi:hypothetical protein